MHVQRAIAAVRALCSTTSWAWLDRSEQLAEDPDSRFIFLWIAFNAAYATEIDERYRLSEQATFRDFLKKLVDLDAEQGRMAELVWEQFPKSIRVLLDNPYVFEGERGLEAG